MSPSEPGGTLTLTIRASDPATEIFVINGDLQLEDRGVGSLTTKPLVPGIYKVKARAGFETREQLIVLREPGQTLVLPPFRFASPAPLNDTSMTHEYHIHAAETESRTVHVNAGQGSSIFVFSREWTASGSQPPTSRRTNPAAGLSLLGAGATPIAQLETAARVDSGVPDPWAACNIQIDPGIYQLGVALPDGGRLEQTVVACPGWQTQIFLLQRDIGGGRCADLPNASVMMARQMGFDSGDGGLRQVELAKLGLTNERKVLSNDVKQMLVGKFDNPMLGIFAGHLLLLEAAPAVRDRSGQVIVPEKKPDMDLLRVVVTNLRGLLQIPHPDVEALALTFSESPYVFTVPPMLRRSWTLVVNATVTRPELVPKESLAEKAARSLWSEEPWLIWSEADAAATEAGIQRAVQAAIRSHLRPTAAKTTRSDSPFAAVRLMREQRATEPAVGAPPVSSESAVPPPGAPEPPAPPLPTDDSKIGLLVRTFGIPRSSVESMLHTISLKEDDDEHE